MHRHVAFNAPNGPRYSRLIDFINALSPPRGACISQWAHTGLHACHSKRSAHSGLTLRSCPQKTRLRVVVHQHRISCTSIDDADIAGLHSIVLRERPPQGCVCLHWRRPQRGQPRGVPLMQVSHQRIRSWLCCFQPCHKMRIQACIWRFRTGGRGRCSWQGKHRHTARQMARDCILVMQAIIQDGHSCDIVAAQVQRFERTHRRRDSAAPQDIE
jgi:hypothetical protein